MCSQQNRDLTLSLLLADDPPTDAENCALTLSQFLINNPPDNGFDFRAIDEVIDRERARVYGPCGEGSTSVIPRRIYDETRSRILRLVRAVPPSLFVGRSHAVPRLIVIDGCNVGRASCGSGREYVLTFLIYTDFSEM
jgi:hypothetical protein